MGFWPPAFIVARRTYDLAIGLFDVFEQERVEFGTDIGGGIICREHLHTSAKCMREGMSARESERDGYDNNSR